MKLLVLAVTSPLILPGLMLMGYVYRVGRTTSAAHWDTTRPPDIHLDEWRELTLEGARLLLLLLLLMTPLSLAFHLATTAGAIPGYLTYILGGYFVTGGFAVFMGTGSLRFVFSHDTLDLIRSWRFIEAYAVYVVVYLTLMALSWLAFFPLADILVQVLPWYVYTALYVVLFYTYILLVTAAYFGNTYRKLEP